MNWSNDEAYRDTAACPKHAPLANLDVKTVVLSCSKSDELKRNLANVRNSYANKQHELIKYNVFAEYFFDTLGVTGNDEYFIGKVKLNYGEYVTKLKELLNASELQEYSTHFIGRLKAKLTELRGITTNEELKEKFPKLQEKYVLGINYYNNIRANLDFMERTPENAKEIAKYQAKEKYYYKCGMRYSVTRFIECQAELLENMINSLDTIRDYIDYNDLNIGTLTGIDHDKFELYVASEYLKQAKKYKINHPNKKLYLKLLKEYFEHVKGKNLSIINQTTMEEITVDGLYSEYLGLITDTVKWEILPEGEPVVNENKEDSKTLAVELSEVPEEEPVELENTFEIVEPKDENSELDLTDPEVIKELTGAEEVGESENMAFFDANKAKVMFYKDSGYIGAARGIKLNKGYTAFIYPNGAVVMDLVATKDHIKDAIGNGIYVVQAKDFVELSMLSKAVLRGMKDRRKFLYHTGDWQERLQKILDETPETEETRAEAENLVRSLRKK